MRALAPTSLRRVVSDTLLSSGLSGVFSIVNFALMLTCDRRLTLTAVAVAVAVTAVAAVLLSGAGLVQLRFEQKLFAESQIDATGFGARWRRPLHSMSLAR